MLFVHFANWSSPTLKQHESGNMKTSKFEVSKTWRNKSTHQRIIGRELEQQWSGITDKEKEESTFDKWIFQRELNR